MRRAATLVIGIALGFGLGLLILFGIKRMQPSPRLRQLLENAGPLKNLEAGAPAPDFALVSISGKQIHLKDLRGQAILLNFWATWCAPCRLEMPAFQSRSEQFPKDLVVLAVNSQDTPADIRTFMDELGLTFNALLDSDEKVHKAYQVRGFPSSYFIDAEGVLRIQHIGVMTEDQLDSYLTELGLTD